jgi:hypothetical protein
VAPADLQTRRGRHGAAEGVGGAAPGRHRLRAGVGHLGIGAIAFGLGAAVLGLDRLRGTRSRPERAIGWVLVLCGAFVVVDALIWMSIGGA